MQVEIDDRSGFCFGVVRAIEHAQQAVARYGTVYCLGDIVHNRMEVQRLSATGLRTVELADVETLQHGERLLIRAHGEPPSTYLTAQKQGLQVIDATCPVVARLQTIAAEADRIMQNVAGQVVILGKPGHAEVVGLLGHITGNVAVVECVEDLDRVDFRRPIYFISQTTQSLERFEQLKDRLLERAADPTQVTIRDTICRNVAGREPHLSEFARRFDVVIFVAGRKSSNGKVLYARCREANVHSFLIENESELDPKWFDKAESIGICGATSTPKWLMEQVRQAILTRFA